MDCKEVRETIFLFTDGEMGEDLVVSFRAHMALCPDCARQIDYTRKLLLLVRERCCRQSAPERLRHRIHENLLGIDGPTSRPERWE
jgi:mycothiol system anti-sigma-R factor